MVSICGIVNGCHLYERLRVQEANFFSFLKGVLDTKLGTDSSKLSHEYNTDGIDYEYSVEWIEGCITSVEKESVYSPEGTDEFGHTCLGLFSSCYEECKSESSQEIVIGKCRLTVESGNNGGVGGSMVYGCLKYTFTGK